MLSLRRGSIPATLLGGLDPIPLAAREKTLAPRSVWTSRLTHETSSYSSRRFASEITHRRLTIHIMHRTRLPIPTSNTIRPCGNARQPALCLWGQDPADDCLDVRVKVYLCDGRDYFVSCCTPGEGWTCEGE